MSAQNGTGMAQRVLANGVQDGAIFWARCLVLMVNGDLFQRFQNEGTNPDANVGGEDVHQTEPSQYFEAMDV